MLKRVVESFSPSCKMFGFRGGDRPPLVHRHEVLVDPRDGKPGYMTQRSSKTEVERKRRMAEPAPEHTEPRKVPFTSKTPATYSTVMKGRGLGVMDWVPFEPQVAKKWEWELPDEPAPVNTSLDTSLDGERTSIEMAFQRWGRTAPRWMIKAERKLRERFGKKKKKRRRKKKTDENEQKVEEPIPLVPVPETISGMLLQAAKETLENHTSGIRSRIEYQRRIRQVEGPGVLERALLDFVAVPSYLLVLELYLYMSAFWRVNEGFARKIIVNNDGDDDNDDVVVVVATWRQLELHQQRVQTVAALAAFISLIIGLFVNELQFRGFIPG